MEPSTAADPLEMSRRHIDAFKESMALISAVMKRKGLTRDGLTDFLSQTLNRPVSRDAVQCWFKVSRPDMRPDIAEYLLILEYIGDGSPLDAFLAPFDRASHSLADARLFELGKKTEDLINMTTNQ